MNRQTTTAARIGAAGASSRFGAVLDDDGGVGDLLLPALPWEKVPYPVPYSYSYEFDDLQYCTGTVLYALYSRIAVQYPVALQIAKRLRIGTRNGTVRYGTVVVF